MTSAPADSGDANEGHHIIDYAFAYPRVKPTVDTVMEMRRGKCRRGIGGRGRHHGQTACRPLGPQSTGIFSERGAPCSALGISTRSTPF